MNRGPAILLLAFSLLVTGAGVVVAIGHRQDPEADRRAAEFHGLVGGIGGGPATDLSNCSCDFDPRLDAVCSPVTGAPPF